MSVLRTMCALFILVAVAGCGQPPAEPVAEPVPETGDPSLRLEGETHLANIRQLTFSGENAEAYWSSDGTKLIVQSKLEDMGCDQIYILDVETGERTRVSNGEGATTCAYLFPDGERALYSSTHLAGADCPPPPDYSKGYVWRLHPEFDVFTSNVDGTGITRITDGPDYDAEATLSTDGTRVIFTSLRDGDLDLYTMRPDGSDLLRITDTMGYDGGAFFSRDGTKIVWRASRPQTEDEKKDYRALLDAHQIRPMVLELFVADADGSNAVQVTEAGAASFGPYFFPDAQRIIFSSNLGDRGGRNFDLWMVGVDGTGMEQVTFNPTFDGFPMFSPDGTKLAFASNRHNAKEGDTNIFIADWVD